MLDWVWAISPALWLAAALLLGVSLIVVGWRGRRIGDEPRCRRCRYILSDLPTTICPECGLNSAKHRPRRGVRKVRVGALLPGFALVLFSAGAAAWVWNNVNWRTQAPLWMLLTAMDFGDWKAQAELATRVRTQSLTDAQLRSTVARGLNVQKSAPLASKRLSVWLSALADFDQLDLLSDTEWERMVRQMVRGYTVRVREKNRQHTRLPIELIVSLAMPTAYEFDWGADVNEVGGLPSGVWNWREEDPLGPTGPWLRIRARERRFTADIARPFPLGDQDLTFTVFGWLKAGVNIKSIPTRDDWRAVRPSKRPWFRNLPVWRQPGFHDIAPDASDIVDAETREAFERSRGALRLEAMSHSTILPDSSSDDVIPLHGADIRAAVTAALSLRRGDSQARYEWLLVAARHYKIPEIAQVSALPCALAYNIFARVNGREVRVGEFVWRSETIGQNIRLEDTRFRDAKDQRVTLILRPAPDLLRGTIDVRYADEVIELGPLDLSKK